MTTSQSRLCNSADTTRGQTSQRTPDAKITSLWRRDVVLTSWCRYYCVIIASCARWDRIRLQCPAMGNIEGNSVDRQLYNDPGTPCRIYDKIRWQLSIKPTRTTRTPAFWGYPPPPHDYPYYWPVHFESQVHTIDQFISDPKSKQGESRKIRKHCEKLKF